MNDHYFDGDVVFLVSKDGKYIIFNKRHENTRIRKGGYNEEGKYLGSTWEVDYWAQVCISTEHFNKLVSDTKYDDEFRKHFINKSESIISQFTIRYPNHFIEDSEDKILFYKPDTKKIEKKYEIYYGGEDIGLTIKDFELKKYKRGIMSFDLNL
jgi:hypothetical protein